MIARPLPPPAHGLAQEREMPAAGDRAQQIVAPPSEGR